MSRTPARTHTDFHYPFDDYVTLFKAFYAAINGPGSFEPEKRLQSESWAYRILCSRGPVLEKAGFALLHIGDGVIYQEPGRLKLFETLVYPANPRTPGLIFVVNLNETKARGKTIVYLIDLIIQDGRPHEEDKRTLAATIEKVCARHGRTLEERYALAPGRLLAGSGAECGIMNFFTEADISFLDDLIKAALPAYGEILESTRQEPPLREDYDRMNASRRRIVEWITVEDIGVQIARDNAIPLHVIETYAFPPVVRY